jgi:hypothetical protein
VGDASLSPLGRALANAIGRVRAGLGDPFAPVVVLAPAGPNGVLARRTLALEGPQLRVWFETPEGLLRAQLPVGFWRELREEPPGWARATLGRLVLGLGAEGRLGRFAETLARRGWRDPLAASLAWLEGQGVGAAALEALAVDAGTASHLAERARILRALLAGLEAARAAEGIAAPGALAAAATAAVGGREGVGASLARGVVVLGDRELPRTLSGFLTRWLAGRAVVRIALPGAAALPLAPSGLAAAAGDCPVVEVALVEGEVPEGLRALLNRLFGGGGGAPAPDDGSVVLARTPDDVRETVECVREVQRALARGVPLDRIAIVLPDAGQAAALEEALARAEIPATFLVGRPARELGAARLLRVALDVALGEETPSRLYELLGHPALGLRGALGPEAVRGKGRWRRLLGTLASARGLARIAAGIERLELETERGPEEVAREQAARASLTGAIRALEAALAPLRAPGSLGAHARAWTAFLERFGRRSEARGRLLALLDPLASARASGPELGAAEARVELDSLLERELTRGNLSERSLRVLAPMSLLGGEFDTVCLLGLSEGRFPTAAHEDAILPDELLEGLAARLGRPLPLSREHEALERRRLAAALGAARRTLWLSVPGLDFETERPTLASSLALEVASALLGRRARYRDLEPPRGAGAGAAALTVRAGSRAQAYPPDPADAVGALEHLVTRVARGDAGARAALASHLVSRGVLQLHRSMHRACRSRELDAWTGLVPPAVLAVPGLDGTPLAPHALAALLEQPGDFFFRQMLGAFPPKPLRSYRPPLEREALEDLLAGLGDGAVVPAGDVGQALVDGALVHLEAERELGAFAAEELALARPMLRTLAAGLAAEAEGYCRERPEAGPLLVAAGLPWQLAAPRGRLVTEGDRRTLIAILARFPQQGSALRLDVTLSALALETAGRAPGGVGLVAAAGGRKGAKLQQQLDRARVLLASATEAAREGRFAVGSSRRFGLATDARRPVEEPGEVEAEP